MCKMINAPSISDLCKRENVMITYVSKENNLGPDDKIRYIWGLKGPISFFFFFFFFFFGKAQLVHTNFLYPYKMSNVTYHFMK